MTTSNVNTDIGGIADMGRLMPAVVWEPDPGVVPNHGVLDNHVGTRVLTGIGNRVVIYPYWNLLALQAGPVLTDIKNFDIYIRHGFEHFARSSYLQGKYLTEFFSDFPNYFAMADIQPGPNENISQATLQTVSWEGFSLPDCRTDQWPPNEISGTPPGLASFPIITTTSLAENITVIVVVNSVGGVGTDPESRAGEYFKALVAVGGLARSF